MPVECPQCNTSNSDEVLYCTACGKLLVPYESEEPVEEPAQTFASRMSRLGAALLDGLIAGAAYLVLLYISPGLGLLLLLAIFIVQAVLLTRDGQSLGKKALNIRIVVYRTGENGGFVPNVLLRVVLNGLLGFITLYLLGGIPLYSVVDALFIFRNDRRCIHDLVAGTVVVNA